MIFTYKENELAKIQMYHEESAKAYIRGGEKNPSLFAEALFYQLPNGVLVVISAENLPQTETGFFAFHLHNGKSCTGNSEDEFLNAGEHYNPKNSPHPEHSGDFPPLISAEGNAYLAFVTDRFKISDIIGNALIIHDNPDDFKTQPSGDAGEKIACGIIVKA